MSHSEQMAFVTSVRDRHPYWFAGRRVLEIGSRNVNGSVRTLFSECDYTGIDCHAGPDVDVVTLAHEFTPIGTFETIVSCEAFEHDPHLRLTIAAVKRLLCRGGMFVATWAGPERAEHGTRRTNRNVLGPDQDYYRGIGAREMEGLLGDYFRPAELSSRPGPEGGELDVYFFGVKCR